MIPFAPIAVVLAVKSAEKFVKQKAKRPGKWLLGEDFDPSVYDAKDCIPGTWDTDWSPCSAECGGGTQVLKRRMDTPARNGGGSCPDAEIYANCNMERCPTDCIPGSQSIIPELPPGQTDWDDRSQGWTRCDADVCDTFGYQYTYRDTQYDIEGTPDGAKCPRVKQSRTCSTPCPDPADFLSLLSKNNVHSSTLTGSIKTKILDQLHTPGLGWGMFSFEYKYPGRIDNGGLIMKFQIDYNSYNFFNTIKLPDGKYELVLGSKKFIGIPELSDDSIHSSRGSNRRLVIGSDSQNDLVTIEFVPTISDAESGVEVEVIRYNRQSPYL